MGVLSYVHSTVQYLGVGWGVGGGVGRVDKLPKRCC